MNAKMSPYAYKILFLFFISKLCGDGFLGKISGGAWLSNKGIDNAYLIAHFSVQ
jgi:hypothetical protein